jgi:putative peptidoglycan lipid II flippase
MLSNASMLPLGALMVGLAVPIVALIYERGAFNAEAADLVGQLLMAYGIGMPAYLARDVLVRVFYALGDGVTPFRWSLGGIGMNALFCWLFVGGPTPWAVQTLPLNFGAAGLVMATVAVNLITCLGLLLALQGRLGGLPLRLWARDSLLLLASAVAAGLAAWGLASAVAWPANLLGRLLECSLASAAALLVYGLIASWARVPEVHQITRQLRARIPGLR